MAEHDEDRPAAPRTRLQHFWQEWVKPLLVVGLVLLSFRSAIADWNDVPTGSMKPTILEGDRVFVNKLAYDLKVPFTTWHLAQWADPRARRHRRALLARTTASGWSSASSAIPGDRIEMRSTSCS